MDRNTINKIVWWIPIRSIRDKMRDKLNEKLDNKISDELKFPTITWQIDSDDEEDNKKRNIIRDILIKDNENNLDLHNYFIENKNLALHKPLSYFDVYEKHFSKFRGKDITILEIGVQNGGDLKMWEHYFSKNNAKVTIYGIDINEKSKQVENENIKIFIGSQSDREFLRKIKAEIPKVDILIDDGGHTMEQQIVTFEEMYDHIKDDGLYWCEDTGTSYWTSFGGGYKNPSSYIEYTKNLIDYLNAYSAIKKDSLEVTDFTNKTYGIHYYENIVVIEKKIRKIIPDDICSDAIIGVNKLWKKIPVSKTYKVKP